MVRPKKNETALSTTVIIRLHPDDKKIIQERAKKAMLSVSKYMRLMSLDGAINIQESRADFALVQELNKIGVNLNQMVKKFNAVGTTPAPALLSVLSQLQDILFRLIAPDDH